MLNYDFVVNVISMESEIVSHDNDIKSYITSIL